jgi:hypothetical protein
MALMKADVRAKKVAPQPSVFKKRAKAKSDQRRKK